jgi:hypothetical protein
MKPLIAVLAVLLVLPASALAKPMDARDDTRITSSSLGAAPTSLRVPRHLPANGTDVAAPDQQSPKVAPGRAPVPVSASSDFAWSDALVGAGAALGVVALALAGMVATRRVRVPVG